ncbi:YncE family protein [Mycobacterium sp. NPDC051804]|uniref:YncE family protein n=1 Tax=Mycobacterium sp. NPDC051804 TaxID=3364295 RepID=UPI00379FF39B
MPIRVNSRHQVLRFLACAVAIAGLSGCSSNPVDTPPPTIAPAEAAISPPVTGRPAGSVQPLPDRAIAAVFDTKTASLAVLSPKSADKSEITVLGEFDGARAVPLPRPATAMTGDDEGQLYVSTRGGYFRVDVADDTATLIGVDGQQDTDFTAIARREDGKLVLGSADGTVFTLSSETAVAAQVRIFARVDDLVTQGNTTVVLDRGQTSVTALSPDGTEAEQALRAGEGATTMTADEAGRVLVADTRGGQLLVYGLDPLMILRQAYPVREAPYGLAGSSTLAWVSQTATNSVVGYDLSTGIPVEKVRYRTVQQPNSLAYDDASGTLYVVSGSGAGVQVIPGAAVGS